MAAQRVRLTALSAAGGTAFRVAAQREVVDLRQDVGDVRQEVGALRLDVDALREEFYRFRAGSPTH